MYFASESSVSFKPFLVNFAIVLDTQDMSAVLIFLNRKLFKSVVDKKNIMYFCYLSE